MGKMYFSDASGSHQKTLGLQYINIFPILCFPTSTFETEKEFYCKVILHV